jgi:Leucine-rich repeat (LRR) protein
VVVRRASLLAAVAAAVAASGIVAASGADLPSDVRPLASLPGCGGGGSGSKGGGDVLRPGLLDGVCRIPLVLSTAGAPGERRLFSFVLPPPSSPSSSSSSARPYSTQIFLTATDGAAELALYKPGGEPIADRLDGPPDELATPAVEGIDGAREEAFLALGADAEPGSYFLSVKALAGTPRAELSVTTTPSSVRLAEEDRRALAEVADQCCAAGGGGSDGGKATNLPFCSSSANGGFNMASSSAADDWRADLCHTAPNACDAKGHLVRLSLRGAGLSCPTGFPRALAALPALRALDVSRSDFHAQPFNEVERIVAAARSGDSDQPSFAALLESLRVADSNLGGALGCTLLQGSRLRVLDARGNALDGPVPGCLMQSPRLAELYLGRNKLSGPLPEPDSESEAATPSALVALSIDNQQNAAPLEASVEGGMSAFLAQLPSLRYLDVAGNPGLGPWQLSSSSPPKLGFVNASASGLEGQLPDPLPRGLWMLAVSDNPRLGGLLPDLSRSKGLATFAAARCAFTGPLPVSLPSSLRSLDLGRNNLSSSSPQLVLPASLEVLVLDDNPGLALDLSSSPGLFDGGGATDNLVELRLANTSFTGALPPALARAPNLRMLSLAHNRLSGKLPEDWSAARSLEFIDVSENKIGGPVPPSLARLPSLRALHLGNNRLEGTLAPFADALAAKENRILDFNVSGNAGIRGPVPQALDRLALFDAEGVATLQTPPAPLPSGLATMAATRVLALDNMSLKGPFPTWLVTKTPPVRSACACRVDVRLNGANMRLQCPQEGTAATAVSDLEWQVASDLGWECVSPRSGALLLTDVLSSPSVSAAAANRDDAWTIGDGGLPSGGAARAGAIAAIVIAFSLVVTVALGAGWWFFWGGRQWWRGRGGGGVSPRRGGAGGAIKKQGATPFHDMAKAKNSCGGGGGAVSVSAAATGGGDAGAPLPSTLSTATSQGFLLDHAQNNI